MVRTSAASALLALASTCAALAQDAPFRVETPFAGGERWALREQLVTTEVPLGADEDEAEVSRLVWTEAAEVLRRPQGFALRLTLDAFRLDARAPNVETRMRYDEDDLRTIEVEPGREVPFERTWTYEYDDAWTLLDVSGQRETLAQLYDRALVDRAREEGDGCNLGTWLATRARGFVVDRWSRGVEAWQKTVSNQGGAPVRAVMARLRAGGELEPGFAARFEGSEYLPGGVVRLVGRDERGARFRAEFDGSGSDWPLYAFVIDDAGRLAWLETARTEVQGGRRVTSEYTFSIERVERGEAEPAPQGAETPTGEGEPAPPRGAEPF